MSKYSALGEFLKAQRRDTVPLTFAEIERITGVQLPASAHKYRPWWSNNPDNSVMTKIWLDAGFESEQVDMGARKLVFRRAHADKRESGPSAGTARSGGNAANRHPLFGALKGLMRIARGTDLTKPADPRWGQ